MTSTQDVTSTQSKAKRLIPSLMALIAGGGIGIRLWFIFGLRFMEEDSLITLRYSQNLWNTGELVYNSGEKVMGFTSPLWTLLMTGIGGPFGFGAARTIITLVSLGLFGAGFVITIRLMAQVGLSDAARVFVALFLAFHTSLVAESISGMEMSLFYLLVISSAKLVHDDRTVAAFAVASLGVLTRPEGALWWVALFIYCICIRRERLVRRAIPVSVAVYGPWLAFAVAYYGSFIPQSALSKSQWLSGGSLIEALWRPNDLYMISLLMTGSAIWSMPFIIQFAALVAWLGLWGAGLVIAARRGHHLLLLFGGYAAAMILFYYLGRGLVFPWYAFVPNVFFILVVAGTVDWISQRITTAIEDARPERRRLIRGSVAALTALAVLAFLGVMGIRATSWMDVRDYEDNVLRATGEYLETCSAPDATVMLEPLGYVGYFSRRQVMDLAGLVSPEFAPSAEKSMAGWGAEQIEKYRPDWLVLRSYEIPSNRFYASFDKPMFSSPGQEQWLSDNYVGQARFGEGDMSLVALRRHDAANLCA